MPEQNTTISEKFAEADTTGRLATEQDEQVVECRLTQIFQEAKNLRIRLSTYLIKIDEIFYTIFSNVKLPQINT